MSINRKAKHMWIHRDYVVVKHILFFLVLLFFFNFSQVDTATFSELVKGFLEAKKVENY